MNVIRFFENRFADNNSVNLMIYGFVLGGRTIDDPNYDAYPEKIYIHDNEFSGGGTVPGHKALAAWHAVTGMDSPNIVWDGVIKEGGSDDKIVCLANNGQGTTYPASRSLRGLLSRLAEGMKAYLEYGIDLR